VSDERLQEGFHYTFFSFVREAVFVLTIGTIAIVAVIAMVMLAFKVLSVLGKVGEAVGVALCFWAFWVLFAIFVNVIGQVFNGGRVLLQHYILQVLLCKSNQFPRNTTEFLEWSAQRALVQRVGSGWSFRHITLRNHFAERYHDKHPNQR
jgi:hypothetical protein